MGGIGHIKGKNLKILSKNKNIQEVF